MCFSNEHETADCTFSKPKEARIHTCPSCYRRVTRTELLKHKELGCVNVNKPNLEGRW
jgi:hypothetical protein